MQAQMKLIPPISPFLLLPCRDTPPPQVPLDTPLNPTSLPLPSPPFLGLTPLWPGSRPLIQPQLFPGRRGVWVGGGVSPNKPKASE